MGSQDREHIIGGSCSCSCCLCQPPAPLQGGGVGQGCKKDMSRWELCLTICFMNTGNLHPEMLLPSSHHISQLSQTIRNHLPIFPVSNLAHLPVFPLTLRMTQDSLSCQKILLQTITCIVSAAVRRQMSCSLLIPLSRHLSHRSATSQSVCLARLAFGPNPYAVHGLTLQTEPQAYPRTAKGKHYPKYCWKGCLQGVFEWDMRETNS